ncbi:MAG: hypothetical protein AB1609_14640 [Bacillota bacterium]
MDEQREVLARGRRRPVVLFDPEVLDCLIEQGGLRLVGFYVGLCRLADKSQGAAPAETLSERALQRKLGVGKAEFHRLIEVLRRTGLVNVEGASGAGGRCLYVVHSLPGYESPPHDSCQNLL